MQIPFLHDILLYDMETYKVLYWQYSGAETPEDWVIEIRAAGPYSAGEQPDFHHAVTQTLTSMLGGSYNVIGDKFTPGGYFGFWVRALHIANGLSSTWERVDGYIPPLI
jgi:hypothetical protein